MAAARGQGAGEAPGRPVRHREGVRRRSREHRIYLARLVCPRWNAARSVRWPLPACPLRRGRAVNPPAGRRAPVGWLRPAPAAEPSRQRVVLWQHAVGGILSPSIDRFVTQAAIAPDGSSIVYTDSVDGKHRLMQKLRGQRDPTPMSGTEGGLSPFFSPDGKWIGYLTLDGKLKKVPAGGGGSLVLSDSASVIYPTAAWMDDGTILYEGFLSELRRVSANGGRSTVVMADSSNLRLTIPVVAPIAGSRGVLFTGCPGNCSNGSSVYVFDFAAGQRSPARGRCRRRLAHSPTGHLLYTDRAGGLFAAGFDASGWPSPPARCRSSRESPRDVRVVTLGSGVVLRRNWRQGPVDPGLGRARWQHGTSLIQPGRERSRIQRSRRTGRRSP